MSRLQPLVYSAALALIVGWILHIGKDIFIPAVFGAVVVYVIVGLTDALRRVPALGRVLPLPFRYLLAMLFIGLALFSIVHLALSNKERIVALAPQYQAALLTAIQNMAVRFGFETEPTWGTIRQDILGQMNIQRFLGSLVASVSSLLVGMIIVLLYATFLLVEMRSFPSKIGQLSTEARNVDRIRQIARDINARIGSYLALKTLLSILLGGICWLVMSWFGLEFAAFWAVLIAFLNFIPYLGSFLGVLFPVAMALAQFQDLNTILLMLACLSAAQFLIGNFLDPYVMGNSLNMSPFAILISLAVWSDLWGISGAFLAVPITAAMTIVFSEFGGTRPIAVLLSKNGKL